MTIKEIVELVEVETGIPLDGMERNKPTTALFARYLAIVLMNEEKHSKPQIAQCFELDRTAVYYALKSIDSLLITNKQFKKMYLACIQRIAEKEEVAA